MVNFAEMKSRRKQNTSKVLEDSKKLKDGKSFADERFWKPTLDSAGNGSAIIRFLMEPPGEDHAWVETFSHGFKFGNKWYIEDCPTTVGGQCPCCDANNDLWNSGDDSQQNLARQRKRKKTFVSNILVVSDPKKPENNGKVFLFRYGTKIMNKIIDKMHPEEGLGDDPINPFDLWEGCNFKFRQTKVDNFPNYDRSEFVGVSAISDDDEEIEAVWKQEMGLQEFVDPAKFKEYDVLQKRLDFVLGNTDSESAAPKSRQPQAAPKRQSTVKPKEDEELESEDDFFDNILDDDIPF